MAVIGDLPAGVTALIINFSSLLTVAFLLSIGVFDRFNIKNADKPKEEWQKTWAAFRNYDLKTYLKMSVLSFFWPFLYSLAYFYAIYIKQASLVVLFNFSWPLFCVIGLRLIDKKKFKLLPFLGILISVIAALGSAFNGQGLDKIAYLMLGLGGIVAATQGGYAAVTDSKWWKDIHPGILTLIGAAITVIFSFLYALIFGEFSLLREINSVSLISLIAIGVLSNGIGFSAFLIANQKTSGTGEQKLKIKAWWLASMSLVPFAQMLFLLVPIKVLQEKANVSSSSWIALSLLIIAFLILRLSNWYEEWSERRKNVL